MPKLNIMDTNDWYYQVTGIDPHGTPFAPNLTKIPKNWFYETPEWFHEKTSQYSGWVSDGEQYDDRGRFAGLIANWDQCYLNIDSVCFTAPKIRDDEPFVYQGTTQTLEGDLVPVYVFAATKGHGDDRMINPLTNTLINQGFLDNNAQPLSASRDIMAHQLIFARFKNLPEGIAMLGGVLPHVSEDMVARINASAISGTWIYDKTYQSHVFAGPVPVNSGALPLKPKDDIRRWNPDDIELRNIAASARYNYIMAVNTTETDEKVTSHECQCKKREVTDQKPTSEEPEKVDAASDPNVGEQIDALSNEELTITLSDLIGRVSVLEDQYGSLDREVANLIRSDEARGEA